jgi:hypothetical protein
MPVGIYASVHVHRSMGRGCSAHPQSGAANPTANPSMRTCPHCHIVASLTRATSQMVTLPDHTYDQGYKLAVLLRCGPPFTLQPIQACCTGDTHLEHSCFQSQHWQPTVVAAQSCQQGALHLQPTCVFQQQWRRECYSCQIVLRVRTRFCRFVPSTCTGYIPTCMDPTTPECKADCHHSSYLASQPEEPGLPQPHRQCLWQRCWAKPAHTQHKVGTAFLPRL